MKKKDIFGQAPDYWKTTDLENLFDISRDGLGRYRFNLNESLYLLVPEGALQTYTCKYEHMHWPLISYVLYGTTRLAWLLMKLNGVSVEDSFMPMSASDKVRYLDKSTLQYIIKSVNGY